MTDEEFIQAIKDRLLASGWQTGRIGTFEGPNCILGAAGFVQHGKALEVDQAGINPLVLDGKFISGDDGYCNIPGMIRLARLLGENAPFKVVAYNDTCDDVDQVFEKIDALIENQKA